MKIKFTLRNERGLHCRFCNASRENTVPRTNLYETSPISGIVCGQCKSHLEKYCDN